LEVSESCDIYATIIQLSDHSRRHLL